MKVSSAEFVKSAFNKGQWTTDHLPEVAFLGRSNVGKSSLINTLLQRKGLARTSNTPGRTQSINYFLINGKFYFVDLPGYGFAKVSKTMRAEWGTMAEEYLGLREQLVLCIQLVDSRHEPTKLDLQLNEWLAFNNKNYIVVATKSDKISSNILQKQLAAIRKAMPGCAVLPYSAQSGKGRDEVWAEIDRAVNRN